MRYPTAVVFKDGIYSAAVPDLPGVKAETDVRGLLEMMVAQAAQLWIKKEIEAERAIPVPTGIENYLGCSEYEDCDWILVDVDLSHLEEEIG